MDWADYKAKVKEALEKSKFDIAETTLLQALQWVKDTGGSNERLCLCLDQLAWIYVNIRDLDRAAACYKESLEIKTSILGEQNPIVARACKKLATVVYMQKRFDLAEKYSKDALNIFKSTLGIDNEETQQTLQDLVSLLRKLNRNYEANILQNMGKTAKTDQPDVQQMQKGYAMGQTFLRIKVCKNCSLPYDGDQCLRCTEGRIVAQQAQQRQEGQGQKEQSTEQSAHSGPQAQLPPQQALQSPPSAPPSSSTNPSPGTAGPGSAVSSEQAEHGQNQSPQGLNRTAQVPAMPLPGESQAQQQVFAQTTASLEQSQKNAVQNPPFPYTDPYKDPYPPKHSSSLPAQPDAFIEQTENSEAEKAKEQQRLNQQQKQSETGSHFE